MIDFYELLGIKKTASKEEIKQAYRKMVKKYHPDINKSNDASQIIISLNEAKEILLDDVKRKEYDAMLDDIIHSKQFSKEPEETYTARTQEYKETYSESYLTKWEFLFDYFKNGLDHFLLKIFKFILVSIYSLVFFAIKIIVIVTMVLINVLGNLVDYLAGLIMFVGILALFIMGGESYPDFIPFLPANIEMFFVMGISAALLEVAKNAIVNGTINLYVLIQNIEDKIFVKILMH